MNTHKGRVNAGTHSGLPKARARFLAQAIALEEEGTAGFVRYSVYTIAALMAAALVWMSLTQVSEVTVTNGKVVPVGYIHNIQHLEGGIVDDIAVEDGQRVSAGDLLLSFSPPASQADLDALRIRKATLQFDQARLAALRTGQPPVFEAQLMQFPRMMHEEKEAIAIARARYESELEVVDARIRQRESELRRQRNQVKQLNTETALLQEQVDIRQTLAERNAVSQTDLLRIRSEHASLESELTSAKDGVTVAWRALEEERRRRDEVLARQRQEIEAESVSTVSQIAEIESALVKARDRVDRLRVYSPVDGIVQALNVTTINAVVKPGEVIMQVVPVDDELMVESRLMPDEVGYIRAGQLADVKVHSYDSSRYGSLEGVVRQISPSTYLDEHAVPYYKVKVGLDRAFLGAREGEMAVIPGMTVEVDIITGSKSVMEYLLRPVSRGFQNAFTQR